MEFTLLRAGKVYIFALSWTEEQQAKQYLTGIKAEYASLGSDIFIRKEHLNGLIAYLKSKSI